MEPLRTDSEQLSLGRSWRRWVAAAGAVGLLGLAASALIGWSTEHGGEFFRSYLLNFMFFLSLALGGLFFVLVSHLTRAGWSVALRRIAEVMAWTVLPLAPLAIVIFFGQHELYEWWDGGLKEAWLKPSRFIIRVVIYFALWIGMALFFLRRSLTQDATGIPRITVQLEKLAAPAMIVYALTVTYAAFDLLMSLDPHWYSTIYGVYFFAGSVLGAFSLVPILILLLQRAGKLRRVITTEHFHDMGKLMFAFVVFWAYIAFSQYMLIWYGNLPEETVWYKVRQTGSWLYLSLLLLFGHFVLPFLWLISRHPKRRRIVLALAGVWLLVMHWFDLFYLVMPGHRPVDAPFHWLDLTCFVGLGGLFFAAVFWRMGGVRLVPVKDPRLAESLGFENA